MKNLKEFKHLYHLYEKGNKKYKIPFFICLLLFVLAFATFLVDNFPFGLTLVMMAMIFPAILFGILWLLAFVRSKKIFKSFTPQQLQMINDEIPSVDMYEGFLVTEQAVLCTQVGLAAIPMENVLWVYADTTVYKLNGIIPIHKDTLLTIAGKNGKKYGFRIKNNGKAFTFLQAELLKHKLDIVFDNEYGLDDIYKKDINRMIAFSQECAEKRQQEKQEN